MKIEDINFMNFTVEQINSVNVDISAIQHQLTEDTKITISDYLQMDIYKSSENMYADIKVYLVDEPNNEKSYLLSIWTKEAHEALKELIQEITKQS